MIHKILRVIGFFVHYTAMFIMMFFVVSSLMSLYDATDLLYTMTISYATAFMQVMYVNGVKKLKGVDYERNS